MSKKPDLRQALAQVPRYSASQNGIVEWEGGAWVKYEDVLAQLAAQDLTDYLPEGIPSETAMSDSVYKEWFGAAARPATPRCICTPQISWDPMCPAHPTKPWWSRS